MRKTSAILTAGLVRPACAGAPPMTFDGFLRRRATRESHDNRTGMLRPTCGVQDGRRHPVLPNDAGVYVRVPLTP